MGVLRSGARGNMPATAKRLASWRVLKEMLQSFLRRCSLLDVLESLTVGTCVQHFFQVLSRGGGSLAQVFACPGHNFFFPCPILRFACPVFVDKCNPRTFTLYIRDRSSTFLRQNGVRFPPPPCATKCISPRFYPRGNNTVHFGIIT